MRGVDVVVVVVDVGGVVDDVVVVVVDVGGVGNQTKASSRK